MRGYFRKAIAVIMVVIMTLTAAPLSGFVGLDLPSLFSFKSEAATYSGTCGANLKWSLNTSTGTLTISGSGAMYNYEMSKKPPWYEYRYTTNIRYLQINKGVTSIGDYAFNCMDQVTSVTIPDSVTFIGDSAFRWCYSITSVYLPSSVTYIDDLAFCYCTNLRSINIPSSVKTIGISAFANCTSLKSATIPASVTTIAGEPFSACTALTQITVNSDNLYYSNDSYGVLFNKDKSELIQYPAGNTRTSYTIPNSVKIIGIAAFNKSVKLTSVTIPDSVTYIGDWAFDACEKIQNITIPDSVTKLGMASFRKCYALKNVTIGSGITAIENGVFNYCENLKNVTIGNNVNSIGFQAFYGCKSIKDIIIPESVELIDEYAFSDCTGLANITLTNGLKTIKEGAFSYCTNLKKVLIPDSVTSIENRSFNACSSLEYVHIPSSLKNIEEDILYDTSAYICSTTEDCYAKTYADYNGIKFQKCNGHNIAVFSTEKSFTVKTGDKMSLAFGYVNGTELDGEWKKMAITVSDPTVVSLSDYKKTDYGYMIDVVGKKEGVANLTITDTETGLNTVVMVTVSDKYTKTYSYAIDNMPSFYPNNKWENNIQTNIYNLNGLYINNYSYTKLGDKYKVSFNAYNKQHHIAAVDIYDADGNWLGSEEIKKNSMASSLYEVGEQTVQLIFVGERFSYTHPMNSQETKISFEVPDGGHFTISNNLAESPGCFAYNAAEIFFDGIAALFELAVGDIKTPFGKLVMNDLKADKDKRSLFIQLFEDTAVNEIRNYGKNLSKGANDSSYTGLCGVFKNALYSIGWDAEHLLSTEFDVLESVLKKSNILVELGFESCFAISDITNRYLQAMDIGWSMDEPYMCVYTDVGEGYLNPHGIYVNTNGNTDAETVLQVFRISNDDSVKVVLDSDNPLEMHELYNISFVKDDKNVQPNGKVKVHVPIPEGMDSSTCKIYRQESNGSWTILNAKVEGNYLVFETDHFSLYAIVGNKAELKIASMPEKITYSIGENIDLTGLSLELNGKIITSGFYCDPAVAYGIGTQVITVNYGGVSAELEITVTAEKPVIVSPSTTTVNYGETLVLQLEEFELPEGYTVEWIVDGDGFSKAVSEDGTECRLTSTANGTATVTAKIVDENGEAVLDGDGNEISDSITLTSKAGFFQKLISFFKNLFGINRDIY